MMWQRFNGGSNNLRNNLNANNSNSNNPLSRSLATLPTQNAVAGQIVGARGSRYSAADEDFFQEAANTFTSPVHQNRFNSRLNNSASQRYSVLGNLQRRTRVGGTDNNNSSLENSNESGAVADP